MATSQDINSLFKSTLGRSADKGGLDYYTKMANEKGVDWVKNSLSGSQEAQEYGASRKARTVSQADRVSGITYRNSAPSSASPGSSSGSSGSSSSGGVSNDSLNNLYKQYLGRSVDKSGLDYYLNSGKSLSQIQNELSRSSEAGLYGQRGSGLLVSSSDQVDGFNYRNSSELATQQARNQADYNILQNGMNQMAGSGNFETVEDESGNILYRSRTGGLYDINGQPVQERPTRGAPQSTVSPNQTSQYQLEQILASDSPLMQRAATQGQQLANQRMLLNSSMAGEAAQGAMIDRATPFAQQDAQTYFQNSQANADRQMQSYMSDKQFGQTMQQMQQQYGYNSQLSSQEAQQSLSNLYATSTANAWGVFANNATDLIGQASSAINQIQMNPDITADNKTAMIQQVLDQRDTDLQFQTDLYGNLSSYLKNTGLFPNMA
ncbi:hypothetical protein [Halomonas sp. IOP_31]|uniref:hypothetical protein n=1 Tax=Halomonas sp. IOP_31 TaxID=2876584 RepID=UPI001E3534C1|nr:hypothetical protein [Halomonas sp. IOP_31]MCD6006914.1 hypothetical protein [Halomonas sp. IOP_31]